MPSRAREWQCWRGSKRRRRKAGAALCPPLGNDQGYAWFAGPGLSLSRRAAADQALRASRFLKSVTSIRVGGRAGNELDGCQFASKTGSPSLPARSVTFCLRCVPIAYRSASDGGPQSMLTVARDRSASAARASKHSRVGEDHHDRFYHHMADRRRGCGLACQPARERPRPWTHRQYRCRHRRGRDRRLAVAVDRVRYRRRHCCPNPRRRHRRGDPPAYRGFLQKIAFARLGKRASPSSTASRAKRPGLCAWRSSLSPWSPSWSRWRARFSWDARATWSEEPPGVHNPTRAPGMRPHRLFCFREEFLRRLHDGYILIHQTMTAQPFVICLQRLRLEERAAAALAHVIAVEPQRDVLRICDAVGEKLAASYLGDVDRDLRVTGRGHRIKHQADQAADTVFHRHLPSRTTHTGTLARA